VEFANTLRSQKKYSLQKAVIEAATIRLRPILMTTGAMVVGLFPLLTASGAGAVSRFALGLVIITGMLVGTAFTLFVVPVFYTYIAKKDASLL
jgi:multidrug efflux pump subunit AcrB